MGTATYPGCTSCCGPLCLRYTGPTTPCLNLYNAGSGAVFAALTPIASGTSYNYFDFTSCAGGASGATPAPSDGWQGFLLLWDLFGFAAFIRASDGQLTLTSVSDVGAGGTFLPSSGSAGSWTYTLTAAQVVSCLGCLTAESAAEAFDPPCTTYTGTGGKGTYTTPGAASYTFTTTPYSSLPTDCVRDCCGCPDSNEPNATLHASIQVTKCAAATFCCGDGLNVTVALTQGTLCSYTGSVGVGTCVTGGVTYTGTLSLTIHPSLPNANFGWIAIMQISWTGGGNTITYSSAGGSEHHYGLNSSGTGLFECNPFLLNFDGFLLSPSNANWCTVTIDLTVTN